MSRSERWDPPINPIQDDSEAHFAVIGRTGKGKSQCCSLPYMRRCLEKGESILMLDPKGEGFRKNFCYIPENYQIFCIDFRNPRRSPTKWNPLSAPYRLFCSGDPDDNDVASSMISEFWSGVYPPEGSDQFWPDASAQYAKGLTYGLFETAAPDQINLNNVAIMMEQSEIGLGAGTVVKSFYDNLPLDSLAKRNLATYVTGPKDTRGSIHSVAARGLEVFSRSRGLMEMLGEDTLNILDIDVDRPFFFVVITPDETNVYDKLSGLLISQVSEHLIRVAQERGGRLPIRVNIILEELGSVGKSIPSLPNLMVAGRSRNIRLMLILQSQSQLVDVYGKSNAEIINSCIGITIGFSTNSWDTLTEWAQRCGERQVESNGHVVKEQLITAPQLAAMPTGTALVQVDSRHKFIARLPFYDEIYDTSGWKAPRLRASAGKSRLKPFSFEALVRSLKKRRIESDLTETSRRKPPERAFEVPFLEDSGGSMIDFAKLDEKITELEAAEAERKKREAPKKHHVLILGDQGNKASVAQVIADATGESLASASGRLHSFPVDIAFSTRNEAIKFARNVTNAGGKAILQTP